MALPLPSGLSALDAVLCLYRAQQGGELAGWSQAVHACTCSGLDSEGLREQVVFFDRDGRCCWRLCLLPDTDFLAWEEMSARLPAATLAPRSGGIGERLDAEAISISASKGDRRLRDQRQRPATVHRLPARAANNVIPLFRPIPGAQA